MILITGASGNVGGEVLKQAAAARLPLRAAYQSPEKARSAPAGVESVVMDYAKAETIRPALKGIATVFVVSPAVANLAELEGNPVRECAGAGVRHIVKLSALGGRQAIFPSLHRDSKSTSRRRSFPTPSFGQTASCRTSRRTTAIRSGLRAPSTPLRATA